MALLFAVRVLASAQFVHETERPTPKQPALYVALGSTYWPWQPVHTRVDWILGKATSRCALQPNLPREGLGVLGLMREGALG